MVGCRTPIYQGAVVDRRGDSASVECNSTHVRWTISCVGTEWVDGGGGSDGGNCTTSAGNYVISDRDNPGDTFNAATVQIDDEAITIIRSLKLFKRETLLQYRKSLLIWRVLSLSFAGEDISVQGL